MGFKGLFNLKFRSFPFKKLIFNIFQLRDRRKMIPFFTLLILLCSVLAAKVDANFAKNKQKST
jgi:hypothetical protein